MKTKDDAAGATAGIWEGLGTELQAHMAKVNAATATDFKERMNLRKDPGT